MPEFQEFHSSSLAAWRQQVSKELKGEPAESLNWETSLGFEMPALVNAENAKFLSGETNTLWPYTQGYANEAKPWVIVEAILLSPENIEKCNKLALNALENGATGLHIAGNPGNEALFSQFMEGIFPEFISIWLSGPYQYQMARWLSHLAQQREIATENLQGGLLGDGALSIGSKDLPNMAQVIAALPNFRCLWTDASSFYEQGLTVVEEAAFALFSGKRILNYYTEAGLTPDEIGKYIQFKLSAPLHYYIGIARQRAFRYCWSQVMKAFKPQHYCSAVAGIYTKTCYRHLTKRDVFNNLLRNTTASMSVILGGTDAHEVLPHDMALGSEKNEFSDRMARNIQLILAHECGFDQLIDPAGGAYFLETLTFQLAEAILEKLVEIEALMTWEEWINKGLTNLIRTNQNSIQKEVFTGKTPLLGINIYPNINELNDPFVIEAFKKMENQFRDAAMFENQEISVFLNKINN